MALTLAEANRIVQATIAKADELKIKINVAVCDSGGRLLAFNRMDGAIWAGSYGSQGKAVASAAFGRPSGQVDPSRAIIQGYSFRRGWARDPRPRSGPHRTQWSGRGRLRRGRRHQPGGRGLRHSRGCCALVP